MRTDPRLEPSRESVAATYLAAQIPGWAAGALVAWSLWRWGALPAWIAVVVLLAWVLKDLAMYPYLRRFYRSQPATRRMLGRTGVAVSPLAPTGFVRVHGELWQAKLADGEGRVSEGEGVRVLGMDRLVLLVEPEPRVPTEHGAHI